MGTPRPGPARACKARIRLADLRRSLQILPRHSIFVDAAAADRSIYWRAIGGSRLHLLCIGNVPILV